MAARADADLQASLPSSRNYRQRAEDMVTGKKTIRRGLAAALVVAAVAVLAGCGTKASPSAATPSPKPSPSQGSLAQLAALAGYLGQVKPIATQIETTVTALPDAVKGLAKKPDNTWTASATKLTTISAQLGTDAKNLASLKPPDALHPVQDAAVKGIKDTQAAVAKTTAALNKRVATQGETAATIQLQIISLKNRLAQLGQQLLSAIAGVVASPNSTPTP
jgi:hypothetical protein